MRLSIVTFGIGAAICVNLFAEIPATGPTIDLTAAGAEPSLSAGDAVDVVREGTHLLRRTGQLSHSSDGQLALIRFDAAEGVGDPSTPPPPMIVLQNLNLFLMESVAPGKGTQPIFRVSGTVTEYKGHNYILVDSAQTTLIAPAAPKAAAVKHQATSPPQPAVVNHFTVAPVIAQPPVQVTGDSAQKKMNELLTPPQFEGHGLPVPPDAAPLPTSVTGKAPVDPDAPPMKLIREGTYLTTRMARLSHSPDAQQAYLTFDTDGKTMKDPPMIILPNQKLTAMEGVIASKARDAHFRISGTVTEYRGRNYILLDKAVAIADVEVPF